MSRRRAITTVLAACLLALFPATGAWAADTPSAGERIADALGVSPVYVDESYAEAVPPSRQRQLTMQIKRTGLPIKIVLTPLTKGDAFNGDADVLASVVRDHLPHRDLILITTDGTFTDSLNGYEWPADTHETRDAVAAAGFLDEMRDAGLAELTSKAVELVAGGEGTEAYEEATRDLAEGPEAAPPRPQDSGRAWPAMAAGLAALLVATLLVVRHRRRTVRRPTPEFTAARAAEEAALRRRVETEVVALGEAVQAADASTTPGLPHALNAYAAAGTVLDGARGLPDLAGALALATEGSDALTPTTPPPLPLCFFNPLHGRAARYTNWRRLGRVEATRVAVCPTCATALRTFRAPQSLTDVTEGGHVVPYFEIPAERSVWAATGYGSLPGDGMASRVARGDFTRGVHGVNG